MAAHHFSPPRLSIRFIPIWLLGLSHSVLSLWLIPLALLVGLCFAALGLIMTALAPGYDFFMYYFTLAITPMMLLSGVFFSVTQLPRCCKPCRLSCRCRTRWSSPGH